MSATPNLLILWIAVMPIIITATWTLDLQNLQQSCSAGSQVYYTVLTKVIAPVYVQGIVVPIPQLLYFLINANTCIPHKLSYHTNMNIVNWIIAYYCIIELCQMAKAHLINHPLPEGYYSHV